MTHRTHRPTSISHLVKPIKSVSEPIKSTPSAEPKPKLEEKTSRKPISPDTASTTSFVSEVFARMARTYGYRFTRQYGSEDDGTWAAHLEGLSSYEIAEGFKRLSERETLTGCPSQAIGWPPSAPEFRKLCETEAQPKQAYRLVDEAAMRKRGRLPKPRMSYDAVRPYLQQMRAALQQNDCTPPHSSDFESSGSHSHASAVKSTHSRAQAPTTGYSAYG